VCYITNKYGVKPEVAYTYLDNLRYISDVKDDNMIKLINIKEEIDKEGLLTYGGEINSYLKNKSIEVYGYDYIPNFYKKYLNEIGATIIPKEYGNYKHDIYEFTFIDDEIEYVANRIIDLINSGVDINNIKLTNINRDYIEPIARIFSLYNIPVDLNEDNSIYNTLIAKDFIELYKSNTKEESINLLKEKYDFDDENNNYIFNKLISILNKYTFTEEKCIDNLIYDFKNTKTKKEILKNKVEIINLKDNVFSDDEYIFLMNYNASSIPVSYKDDDYLNDDTKKKIGLETSNELNKIERDIDIKIIKSIKNLEITYKLKTPYDDFIKSTLLDEENFEIKKVPVTNKYSNKMNYLRLSKKLDNLVKFSEKADDLDYLYSMYRDIKYRKFDNTFKGLNKDNLLKLLNNKLSLSYSSMNNFYKCPFRYYMENVLYLSKEEKTFALDIGNIFHELLSKSFTEGFDLDKEFDKVMEGTSVPKEKFFLNKLKDELKFVIDTIKYQNTFSSLDKALYENKIYVNKSGSIRLTFTGTIDKLLYKEEGDKAYIVIIDYKTGNPDINLKNTVYGLDMQLPVYLYLANNMKDIKNVEVIGFYLQHVLDNEIRKVYGKTYSNIKKDNLKLLGYTVDNESKIGLFDKNYSDSEVIKSMKKNNDGSFSSNAKLVTDKQVDGLIKLTEKHIDNAFSEILEGNFDIKPKRIDGDLVSCTFCKYRDVCFRKEENITDLEGYEDLSFLEGGDINGLD
jgi:ATP-dependent helicase/DNAse subunit B